MSSREVDFTASNYSHIGKILRPDTKTQRSRPSRPTKESTGTQPVVSASSKPTKSSTYVIEKSFIPEAASTIPEAHRKMMQPEIDSLRQFIKEKAIKERELSKLIAQDIIKPEDLVRTEKKEEALTDSGIHIDSSGKMRDKNDNLVFAKSQSLQLMANKNKERDHK